MFRGTWQGDMVLALTWWSNCSLAVECMCCRCFTPGAAYFFFLYAAGRGWGSQSARLPEGVEGRERPGMVRCSGALCLGLEKREQWRRVEGGQKTGCQDIFITRFSVPGLRVAQAGHLGEKERSGVGGRPSSCLF